ncbi:MAG: hypothetical protein ABSA92_11660 [Candidatus Bathyarchaeia archaeon]|jgi:DNA-directed RNA polymerase subunit M/transcription elongation factor TFIIS
MSKKQEGKKFGCIKCGHPFEIYPPDSYYVLLTIEPCSQGDSKEIKLTCEKCHAENVRYWDVHHIVVG